MKKQLFFFLCLLFPLPVCSFTMLLAPAGHATDTGRELTFYNPTTKEKTSTYERALTYMWAQALEIELLRRYPQLHIKLSRSPGESLIPLQIVSFANRLPANLVLSFHVFKQEAEKPQLFMYQYSNNPFLEKYGKKPDILSFIPLQQAHLLHKKISTFFAKKIENSLKNAQNGCFFDCAKLEKLPFKPFYGMLYPSIAFELGMNQEDQWKYTISALADALEFLFF